METFRGNEYYTNAVKLNSGRHCLEYLLKARNIKKIYLPYFLCESVRKVCEKCGVEYEFYHIDNNFNPLLSDTPPDSYVYIVNYYGQKSDADILAFKKKYKDVIVDNAQAFFSRPVCGIDTLYTCRKYFGVPDGGYLYTDAVIKENLKTDVSYQRMEFVLGRFELDASTFYAKASSNNKVFENEELKEMSRLTQNLLKGIDYDFVRSKRNENFVFLHKTFENVNKLNIFVPEGPFMYPLYVDNGMEIKKKLAEKKIYIPTLWPDVFDICEKGSMEYDFTENIVPLPVDQRYGIEDMKKVVEAIQKCIN